MSAALLLVLLALAAFAGGAVGWNLKTLAVELRECEWCDAPTEGPNRPHCRRHADEIRARIERRARDGRR